MIDLNQHKSKGCFKIDSQNQKIVVCGENQSKYVLNNNSNYEISKIKIDDCVFDSNDGKKCDYLITARQQNKTEYIYLIELKGHQILKAVNQLNDTLDKLKINNLSARFIYGRIVPTRAYSPNVKNNNYKRLNDRFKSLNGNLKCQIKNEDTI